MKNIFTGVLLLAFSFLGLIVQVKAQTVVATADPNYVCYEGNSQLNAAHGGITGSISYSWTPTTGLDDSTISNPIASNITETIIYTVEVTGNEGTFSDTTKVTVYPLFDIGQITGGNSPICYGADAGILSANPSGGSGDYTITWFDGENNQLGTGSTLAIGTLVNSTSFYYNAVDDAGCGDEDSNPITITVYPEFEIGDISGGITPICYGDDAGPFQANPSNGSGSYTITWYDGDNNPVGNGPTLTISSLTETTSYYYNAVDDAGCGDENSDPITITIYPEFEIGNISGGITPICYGDDAGPFQANPSNGSGSYTITWYDGDNNPVGNGPTLTVSSLTETTSFYYNAVDDAGCGDENSDPITITVYPEFEIGNISGGITPICYGDDAGPFQANPSNGSGSYTITWYDGNNNPVGNGPTLTVSSLTETTSYYYNAVDDAECGDENSDPIEIYVYDQLISFVNDNDTICSNSVPDILTSEVSGGGESYTYQWQESLNDILWSDISGATASFYQPPALDETSYYRLIVDDETCTPVVTNPIKILVIPKEDAVVSITASKNPVCDNELVMFSISDSLNGGSDPNFEWFLNDESKSTDAGWSALVSNNDEVYIQMNSSSKCLNDNPVNSDPITMTVYASPALLNSGDLVPKPVNDPVVLICVDSLETNTYHWFENGEEIQSANEQFYYPGRYDLAFNFGSEYYVMLENEFCFASTNSYTYTITKSGLFEESDVFIVYPNPNRGDFSLVLNEEVIPEDFESCTIRLLDVAGKVVFSEEVFEMTKNIELSGIQKGLYFLEVRMSKSQQQVRKLIIE